MTETENIADETPAEIPAKAKPASAFHSAPKQPAIIPILSYAQAKHALRNNCESFFVLQSQLVTANDIVATQAATAANSATASDSEKPTDKQPTPELKAYIDTTREKYADVFSEPSGLPPDRGIPHAINLVKNAIPPCSRLYRLSPEEQREVVRLVTGLLKTGLIEPSTSSYGSPILFVKKKSGELRMVIDYRALNKLTIKSRFPLPRIDDLFAKLHGTQYFTSLDATSGFHQILLREEGRPKPAFRTPLGHYHFTVLPFGLSNAPATCQAAMNNVFNPAEYSADGTNTPDHALTEFVLVFIDDILIFSKTADDHRRHLDTVLKLLQEKQVLIKAWAQCAWAQPELPYLGHVVGSDGVKPDRAKICS